MPIRFMAGNSPANSKPLSPTNGVFGPFSIDTAKAAGWLLSGDNVYTHTITFDGRFLNGPQPEAPMDLYLYEVVIIPSDSKVGRVATDTYHIVAADETQARMVAVHATGADPLTHVFFVHCLGAMPEYEADSDE